MRHARVAVLGLDLSTRAAAMVAVPTNWAGDWLKVRRHVVGMPLTKQATDMERALRTRWIADQVVRFALDYHCGVGWFESYAFGKHTSSHTLGELGGVVRIALVEAGVIISTANMSTARKLLLGRLPARGSGVKVKDEVFRTLHSAGMPFGPAATARDEADAFTCANLGLSEQGAYCFAQLGGAHDRSRRQSRQR